MTKAEEKKQKYLKHIITNYEIARDDIDKSKERLAETAQELDGIIFTYKTVYELYDRYNPRPGGSFAELEEESLARLLISGCSNSEMTREEVSGFKDSMMPFSAVVSSASSIAVSVADISKNIAEESEEASQFVAKWKLPTPRDNQKELGSKLSVVHSKLKIKLDGAWQTLRDRTKVDRFRQAASSMRELISDTLQTLAPDEEVKKTLWFSPEREGDIPTQRQRAFYAIVGKNKGIDQKDLTAIDELSKNIRLSYKKINKYVHERKEEIRNHEDLEKALGSIFNQTQIYLLEIFRMRKMYFLA